MTEVPEYLLERSRQRRIALGVLADDGSGDGGGSAAGSATAAATPAAGPTQAQMIAAARESAQLEAEPEAPPDPLWVISARRRHRIPIWVLPVLFCLPLWAFVYVQLTEPPPEPITALNEGATTYAVRCASCHGGDGSGSDGGLVGRPLWNGEVLLTFPSLGESFLEWLAVGSEGIGLGQVYGDPNRPGGARVSGGSSNAAAMPAFGDVLNEHQLYAVARYVREVIGGEDISDEAAADRDARWEQLGGGTPADMGGGGH
ncbi:c-type cytochrome [Candidatus Poriferisodalis sp.]|uniref:c-type cytochrome n=1 Tax=Candidatus Poriferisodalis sp. TaxID=3101277 RepID=UPI003B0164A7